MKSVGWSLLVLSVVATAFALLHKRVKHYNLELPRDYPDGSIVVNTEKIREAERQVVHGNDRKKVGESILYLFLVAESENRKDIQDFLRVQRYQGSPYVREIIATADMAYASKRNQVAPESQ